MQRLQAVLFQNYSKELQCITPTFTTFVFHDDYASVTIINLTERKMKKFGLIAWWKCLISLHQPIIIAIGLFQHFYEYCRLIIEQEWIYITHSPFDHISKSQVFIYYPLFSAHYVSKCVLHSSGNSPSYKSNQHILILVRLRWIHLDVYSSNAFYR